MHTDRQLDVPVELGAAWIRGAAPNAIFETTVASDSTTAAPLTLTWRAASASALADDLGGAFTVPSVRVDLGVASASAQLNPLAELFYRVGAAAVVPTATTVTATSTVGGTAALATVPAVMFGADGARTDDSGAAAYVELKANILSYRNYLAATGQLAVNATFSDLVRGLYAGVLVSYPFTMNGVSLQGA